MYFNILRKENSLKINNQVSLFNYVSVSSILAKSISLLIIHKKLFIHLN